MVSRLGQFVRNFALLATFVVIAACSASRPTPSGAAPYAAYVMDARTGETIYETNADARLHPASLTKMMTLYIAFEAIERGEISLDTMVTISKHAAAEPPSRLGLKPGQRIALRHLIRAAAIKSANDAATAIGEAIGGSEDKFAQRMNRTAKAIGMTHSTFQNANGLTRKGHLSSARDMSTLGRRLFYDFPQYYNIFSRRETDAGVTDVVSTNRKFLDMYKGADGIKTGFTNAAGFNLTASAERNGVRIIATVFGGTSTAQRNAKMAELLDLGFSRVKPGKKAVPPAPPVYEAAPAAPVEDPALVAEATGEGTRVVGAKTLRVSSAVAASPRPRARPVIAAEPVQLAAIPEAGAGDDPMAEMIAAEVAVNAMQDDIFGALAEATGEAPASMGATVPGMPPLDDGSVVALAAAAPAAMPEPEPEPAHVPVVIHTSTPVGQVVELAAVEPTPVEVVTRISTSGGRHWGVNIGRFPSRVAAERALTKTMLEESATLNESLRKIVQRSSGYDANFMGLSQKQAELACLRLQARGTQCFAIGP
ncbi:D-alanyl-D-alanine carboxypeptidase family protein [Gemmobacter caeruleus]|uniref:D-alanyl-D-alanine carboxypeptidase family protein n=1 Tax=Gemmobacter caeruleus TaxID=2595004 RepID=UPI0011EE989E|nr:D-alanyl-D-alanine carboxypeptidase family protein [Gemmobacter caeruleus]